MFSKLFQMTLSATVRNFSTTRINYKQFKVAIIGGAGGTGLNVALLLKSNPLIYKLSLYDTAPQVRGVGMDLSHIATQSIVKGYDKERLNESLECCDVIIITPGGKRKPNMKREVHWNENAKIIAEIARAAAKICPECMIAILSNPVNSLVPLTCEIFKQECAFNPNHIFGLTTIDFQRSKVYVGDILGVDPACVSVPVVGGHSIASIIPVFSQCKPALNLSEEQMKALYQKVQLSGETVLRAKHNKTSTLSMAYAAVQFTESLLKAMNCQPNIKQVAYVHCNALGTKYCSSEFILSGDGISKLLPQPKLNKYEEELLNLGKADIKKHVARGEEYAANINPYKAQIKRAN